MRYTVMLIRLFAPAIVCGCFAWVLNVAISRIAANPVVAPGAESAKWILLLVLANTGVFLGYALWRCWRWDTGRELGCIRCGGLLGEERRGRHGRFRRCLACGGAELVQH